MSARHLVESTVDEIEDAAFRTGRPIVRDTAGKRVYLTLEGIVFWAPSPDTSQPVAS